jgi:hypothetical protein
MSITVRPLHPLFCAEIGGVDTGQKMDDATFVRMSGPAGTSSQREPVFFELASIA